MKVEYESNNSGGSWWLKDKHWRDLEKAGWVVGWGQPYFCRSEYPSLNGDRPLDLVECESKAACKGHRAITTYAQAVEMQERWLGALATSATREGLGMDDAIAEWERVTGMSADDAGCSCCGQPHSFTEYGDDGKYMGYGPSVSYDDEDGDDD